jgi:hypothetical protein
MAYTFRIQATFEPTRLSAERLRTAYDKLVPAVERSVDRGTVHTEPEGLDLARQK